MDALRLILLLLGLAIIGFIYLRARNERGDRLKNILRHFDKTFLSSFKSKSAPTSPIHPKRDTSIVDEDLDVIDGIVADRKQGHAHTAEIVMEMTTADMGVGSGEPLVMMLTVMARQGKLSGPVLSDSLHALGFHFGDMMAFNLYSSAEQKKGSAVCTVVNVMEPGSFPDAQLEGIEIPGVILIMQLPGPVEPRVAFEKLLSAGQQLASDLDADLCDERRNRLTQQGIGHMKDAIEAYRFKQKMAQIKRRT